MTNEYKSIKQRIFVDSGVSNGLKYFVWGFYGSVAGALRIPTSIRKSLNGQLYTQRENIDVNMRRDIEDGKSICSSLGYAAALLSSFAYSIYAINYSFVEGNPNLLAHSAFVFTITNLASGIYELGRLSKSKQENLELKALKAQETRKVQSVEDKIQ